MKVVSGEVQLSEAIKKILIPSDNCDEQGVLLYNLDAIIAVGYRVNSYEATQFRIWAREVLKEYIIKGFVMDDERLKGKNRNLTFNFFEYPFVYGHLRHSSKTHLRRFCADSAC